MKRGIVSSNVAGTGRAHSASVVCLQERGISMNKRELIEAVADELGTTKTASAEYVDAVLRTIVAGIQRDEKVALSGFGTFRRRTRKSREIINPSSKERMRLPVTVTVGFTASQTLKDEIRPDELDDGQADDAIREVKPDRAPEAEAATSEDVEKLSHCA
ncbi:MAG: HU family DNA-binding protein [Phycisphaerales bacterium]